MIAKSISALLACCSTIALFACIPVVSGGASEDEQPLAPDRTSGTVGKAVASSREIAGKWDIVRFDDYEPARLEGPNRVAFADFSDGGVGLRIECNYSGAAGTIADGIFVPEQADIAQTAMGCGKEREDRDAALFAFFNRSPTVEQLPDGKLLLRADGIDLVLQRPAQRRLEFLPRPEELDGEWRLIGVTHYLEGNGYAGIGLSDVPGRITLRDGRASYTRCPQYDFAYRYTEDGRLLKTGGPAVAAEPRSCPALSGEPAGSEEMPVPWDAMRVLHASPMVEWAGEEQILVSTSEIGLLLSRAPCRTFEQSDDHLVTREVDCASPR